MAISDTGQVLAEIAIRAAALQAAAAQCEVGETTIAQAREYEQYLREIRPNA